MRSVPVMDFMPKINELWLNQWLLLTGGDFHKKDYNTMTVAWGYFGIMWGKPCAVVVVRPSRHTFKYMEEYDTFTLSAFPEKYRDDLTLLGTKSGRDGNKIAETDLTVFPSQKIAAPGFKEAELIIECKKIYWDDFKAQNFLDSFIDEIYPLKDYHRMYFGEILEIRSIEK